ncbi:MAG: hypothetical protein IT292_11305 [Deltaproteobacteria bacterium]|nr:hypothetical protein [Deltaproteobacteria bacterium]
MVKANKSVNPKLLAVDPSLQSSGWVLFAIEDEAPLSWGVVADNNSKLPLAKRLLTIQERINDIFIDYCLGAKDILVCEGPAPITLNPSSATKVEHVRGIFETLARQHKLTVPGRLNPRTVQIELLGLKGRQLERKEVKQTARNLAQHLYGSKLTELLAGKDDKKLRQDVIDALLIGTLAVAKINLCQRMKISLFDAFNEGERAFKAGSRRGISWRSYVK